MRMQSGPPARSSSGGLPLQDQPRQDIHTCPKKTSEDFPSEVFLVKCEMSLSLPARPVASPLRTLLRRFANPTQVCRPTFQIPPSPIMVRIRAERRSRGSGWLWGLIVFLIVLAVLLIFFLNDDLNVWETEGVAGDTTLTDDTVQTEAPTTYGDDTTYGEEEARAQRPSISSFRALTRRTNTTALYDRRVELDSVRVTRVYNDSTLLVTSGRGDFSDTMRTDQTVPQDTAMSEQILVVVVRSDSGMSAQATNQPVVQEGQTISIQGQVKRLNRLNLPERGIAQSEARAITQRQIYLEIPRHTSSPQSTRSE